MKRFLAALILLPFAPSPFAAALDLETEPASALLDRAVSTADEIRTPPDAPPASLESDTVARVRATLDAVTAGEAVPEADREWVRAALVRLAAPERVERLRGEFGDDPRALRYLLVLTAASPESAAYVLSGLASDADTPAAPGTVLITLEQRDDVESVMNDILWRDGRGVTPERIAAARAALEILSTPERIRDQAWLRAEEYAVGAAWWGATPEELPAERAREFRRFGRELAELRAQAVRALELVPEVPGPGRE